MITFGQALMLLGERMRKDPREPFSLKALAQLPDLGSMMTFIHGAGFKFLGQGSSRAVWLLSPKYVLKLAMNEAGQHQNNAEVQLSFDKELAPILPRMVKADPQYRWVVAELVRPVKDEAEFNKLSGGMTLEVLEDIRKGDIEADIWDDKEGEDPIPPRVKEIFDALVHYYKIGGEPGDAMRLDHWGKTADGRVVLLDFGFTKEVYNRFYVDRHPLDEPLEFTPDQAASLLAKGRKLTGNKRRPWTSAWDKDTE